MEKYENYSEIQMVRGFELRQLPSYKILESFPSNQEVETVYLSKQVPSPHGGYDNLSEAVTHVVTAPCFLVGRPKEDVENDLRKKIDDHSAEFQKYEENIKDLEKEINKLNNHIHSQETSLARLEKERSENKELLNVKQRMERDLAKLRQAFGDVAINKVLGDEEI